MTAEEIAIQLHEEGSCEPTECPYCEPTNGGLHPIGCECKDCLAEDDGEQVNTGSEWEDV